MTVRRILERKNRKVTTVPPSTLLTEVLEKLEFEDVGALVVSSNGKAVDGIISERDIVRGLRYFGAEALEQPVCDHMTTDVVTCELHDPVINVTVLMNDNTIRHVPVVDSGRLIGMISVHDIVKDRLAEVEFDANAMRSYISGTV